MIYERVNFNCDEVKRLSRDEFIAMHKDVLWTDRDEDIRLKMLRQVHGLITDDPEYPKKSSEE